MGIELCAIYDYFCRNHYAFYYFWQPIIPIRDKRQIPIWDNTDRGDFVRLKELRKSKNISQLKLALDLNTNQNTISRYESGEREPGLSGLIKIADYFDVSIDYLLCRTDNPKMNK